MPGKRRAILHIGTEKTGTTSIQFVLGHSRDILLRRGFAYSASAGHTNHMRLAAFAGDPARVAELRSQVQREPGAGGAAEAFPEDLAREIAGLPESAHTMIFSGEHCHSRLVTRDSVQRLKTLLDEHFSDYRIIVYLRRQDELAASFYTTRVRNGERNVTLLPQQQALLPYYDYAAMLDRWGSVFGQASLQPRLYGRQHFAGGDLIQDFLAACGIADLTLPAMEDRQNPSLMPAAQEFLRRFNDTPAGALRPRPRWVFRLMNRRFAGPGRKPARAAAEAFVARYAAGNERIRATFFPHLERLFPADFSANPAEEIPVSDADVLEVAMAVVAHLSQPRGPGARARRKQGDEAA